MATQSVLDTCKAALTRVQGFDANTLSREDDLGRQLSFADAVKPADALIGIYKRIPESVLDDFSDSQLNTIAQQAQADFNIFQQILQFDATAVDAPNVRLNIISSLTARRDALFDSLWQFIAYGVARTTDTSLLETQARAAIQSIQDQAATITDELQTAKTNADSALAAIRAVASEQGVSQQAIYFKDESTDQESLAREWLTRTYQFAAVLIGFAVLSLFLHKVEWIRPTSTAEMAQLITSKMLIFAVLAYLTILAAKNYATHKHNSTVNKHRQNALLTYRALVEASGEKGTEDIILAHAASCIFSPQDTGFSAGRGDSNTGSKSVLELMTKGAQRAGEQ